jgi:hypothetical protein
VIWNVGLPLRREKLFSMFSMSLTQDIPEWLFTTVVILLVGLMIGFLIWGAILEIRYISPFTLIKTSNKEKWRRAIVLALLQTSMLPILGLAMPILSTSPEKLPMFLFCNGAWLIAFPVTILHKRWEFERHIKRLRYFDKMIKDNNGVYNRIFANPLVNLTRIFMTAEQKRFFSNGFSEGIDDKKDDVSSGQE